jgi:hypothetical protein
VEVISGSGASARVICGLAVVCFCVKVLAGARASGEVDFGRGGTSAAAMGLVGVRVGSATCRLRVGAAAAVFTCGEVASVFRATAEAAAASGAAGASTAAGVAVVSVVCRSTLVDEARAASMPEGRG